MSETGTWKRSIQPIEGKTKDAPMVQIAENAVSAHRTQLYCIFEVRWDDGRSRFAWERSGQGSGAGEWVTTMFDLYTGEQFDVSSNDTDVEARRVQTKELPLQILEHWPRVGEDHKFAPQGYGDSKDHVVGPAFFEELREKMKRPEDCEECDGTGTITIKHLPELVMMGAAPETEEIPCSACALLRALCESTRVESKDAVIVE